MAQVANRLQRRVRGGTVRTCRHVDRMLPHNPLPFARIIAIGFLHMKERSELTKMAGYLPSPAESLPAAADRAHHLS